MKKVLLVVAAIAISMSLSTLTAEASILMDGVTGYLHANFDATVYWRVYSPGDVSSPLGSIGDYGYYYQIYNAGHTGDNALTQFGVDNPTGVQITSVGYLINDVVNNQPVNLNGLTGSVAPNMATTSSQDCGLWTFQSPSIALGNSSYLLYFTTPHAPTMVNGGVQAGSRNTENPVPGPMVPEPASAMLLGMGLIGYAGRAIRRKFMA